MTQPYSVKPHKAKPVTETVDEVKLATAGAVVGMVAFLMVVVV